MNHGFADFARYEIINMLANKYNLKSYLEIGYQRGICYNNVNIYDKTAVDPSPLELQRTSDNNIPVLNVRLYLTTSDNFFSNTNKKWDFIFIDGLHTYDQVKRDLDNSLNHLSDDGIIMLHDMSPSTFERAISFNEGGQWNGDCYKVGIDIYNGEYDFEYYTVDIDQGCMVIFPSKKRNVHKNSVNKNFYDFDRERTKVLNLISSDDFLNK